MFLQMLQSLLTLLLPFLQISGWPGMQISVPIEMIDEANQLVSSFIQLEPADSNNQVMLR